MKIMKSNLQTDLQSSKISFRKDSSKLK